MGNNRIIMRNYGVDRVTNLCSIKIYCTPGPKLDLSKSFICGCPRESCIEAGEYIRDFMNNAERNIYHAYTVVLHNGSSELIGVHSRSVGSPSIYRGALEEFRGKVSWLDGLTSEQAEDIRFGRGEGVQRNGNGKRK